MTLDEARTIWLTLVGTDWVTRYELMSSIYYDETIRPAYTALRLASDLDVDFAQDKVRIKCKS